MKLSPVVLSIIVGVFILVDGQKGCRRRRIKYVQQTLPPPPPPPTSAFTFQSFDDDIIGRDVYTDVGNTENSHHPNLSCLLFADDGCNVSCNLMCDINGCQSDGYCSQKLHCICNEVYFIQNQAVTADQFKKLAFDDLWTYKFKSSNNSPNLKNRIFQNKQLYNFVMPLLRNPHTTGRDIKQALVQKYPKLSSAAENLLPREHGVKAKLFGNNEGEENLHQYIQNMMNSIQNSIYDRLSHTRYMRRIINLIKNIDNKDDLSYILRQIRQIGNERLFERVRRYLMKRGYFFDDDLRPISKKSGSCMKKKAKCKCKKKFKTKPKRFFYNYGNTFVNDEGGSDWVEDEEEIIELALINELIGSNNAEGTYPNNTILDKQPMPEVDYTTGQINEEVPVTQDTIITQPSTAINVISDKSTGFDKTPMLPQNDASYAITFGGSGDSDVISQQPKIFVQQKNHPEYEVPVAEDMTIMEPTQTIINVIPDKTTQFKKNSMVTPIDTTYIITSDGPNYFETISQQPTTYAQQMNHQEYEIPVIDNATIMKPSRTTFNILPEKITQFRQNTMVPLTDTTYAITSDTPYYSETISQDPKVFVQKMNYPEYGTFFNGVENDYIFNKPKPDSFTNMFTNYENQPIPDSFMTPQTIYIEEKVQPSNVPLQNPNYLSKSATTSTPLTISSQILEKPPQTLIMEPNVLNSPSNAGGIPAIVKPPTPPIMPDTEQIHESTISPPQILQKPSKPFWPTQNLGDLTPTITTSQKLENPSLIQNSSIIQKPQLIKPTQNLLQQFVAENPTPKLPDLSPYLNKPSNIDLKVFDVPNTAPSVESSFVKHHHSPEKTDTIATLPSSSQTPINSPESYTEYFIEEERPVPPPLPMSENQYVSYTQSPLNNGSPILQQIMSESEVIPSLTQTQAQPKLYSESPYSTSLHRPNLPQIDNTESYNYNLFNNNNDLNSPPTYPLPNDNFSDKRIHTSQMYVPEVPLTPTPTPSPPAIQKPKNKIYYQILMDENGNIIKSANYQYANQPQQYQDTQLPSAPIPQYTSMTAQADQPLLDKFDKQTLLNAAKAKPGESVAIDYDLENTDNVPVFDIPSDIDMASGTFNMSPDAFNEYVIQHNKNNGDYWETLPITYTNKDTYEVKNNPEIISGQIPGMDLPITDTQYPFEVDTNNLQIQSNDGLALDYEGNGTGNNNWSTYSIGDTGTSNNIPIEYQNNMIDMDMMSINNRPEIILSGNTVMHNDSNSDEGLINIEIHDGLNGADETASMHGSEFNFNNFKNFQVQQGNKIPQIMNSDENGITIDIMGESNSAEGIANRYKSASKSGSVIKTSYQTSTKTTNDNIVPIKVVNHMDHITSNDAEDISTACDLPVDPEDDLLNF